MSGQTHHTSAHLRREFTIWSAGAVAFAFISPIVALYSIFALVITASGARGWWAFPIGLAGQILVVLVFGELASRWPIEGSVYQWVRRLAPTWLGWMTGWLYAWTLTISTAAVAYGTATFLPPAVGLQPFDTWTTIAVAIGIVALVTAVNAAGRSVVKYLVWAALVAELVGSVAIGVYLIAFHKMQPLSVLFNGAASNGTDSSWSGLLAAVAFVGWSFVGFEAASSISEEVRNPERAVPKAMIVSLLSVALVVSFSALSIILATPDLAAASTSGSGDLVIDVLTARLGSTIAQPVFVLLLVAFFATLVAVQASASRLVFALARDRALPCAAGVAKLSLKHGLPVTALHVVGVASTLILITSSIGDVYTTLIGFTVGGFFITFSLVLSARTVYQFRHGWPRSTFSLGRLSFPIAVFATVWSVFQTVNIAWPRIAEAPWYERYSVPLMLLILTIVGLVVYATRRTSITPITDLSPTTPTDIAHDTQHNPLETGAAR